MIEFKKADINDAEALAIARVDFLCDAHALADEGEKAELLLNSIEYFTNVLPGGDMVAWIALDDGKIAGTSGVTFYRHPPNRQNPSGWVACVSNMFTYPQHRGQGIATKLFSLSVDEARSRGCGKVWLNATDMGRPIYAKYGFTDAVGDMVYLTD